MNFSEWRGPSMQEGQQTIFFAESTDLVHWTRLGNEYEFRPDTRWYRVDEGSASRWDCIYPLPRAGGGLYGYWTGNPSAFHPGFGFGETLDGKTWRSLPPPEIHWGDVTPMTHLEAGAIERFGDRYYAMLGSYSLYQGHSMGMYLFTTDQPQGPFTPVADNYEVLTSPEKLRTSYFARFFPVNGEVLVNHQVMTRSDERYFAPLKRAVVDARGTFRLMYWPQNDLLKGERVELGGSAAGEGLTLFDASVDARDGFVLEGTASGLSTANNVRPGFYFEQTPGAGTIALIGSGGRVEFGQMQFDTQAFTREDFVDRGLERADSARVRLLVHHTLIELYLDDVLIQAFSLPDDWTGRMGVLGAPRASLTGLSAYKMSL
jgi:hypothetical protein